MEPNPGTPALSPDAEPAGTLERPRSLRPILVAAVLALAAIWAFGSIAMGGDLGHAISHLLPAGLEGCGGG